jgi:uncharacterized metal-binding protein
LKRDEDERTEERIRRDFASTGRFGDNRTSSAPVPMGCSLSMHREEDTMNDIAGDARKVIILNGCTDRCATKKLRAAGFAEGTELIVTDLGIEKKGMEEVRFAEIGIVAMAVMDIIRNGST